MPIRMWNASPDRAWLFAAGCALGILAGCGSSSGPGGEQPDPARVAFPLEGAVSNIQVQAGQTREYMFTLQMPPNMQSVQGVELDIAGTLLHGQLTDVSVLSLLSRELSSRVGLADDPGAIAFMRVGTDSATVCTDGTLYGPFNVSYSTSLEVDPPTATADSTTLQIMNAGSFVICMSITSNFDATFSLDSLEANVTQEGCAAPGSFAGEWSGTYQCGNSCTGYAFGGPSELVVTQEGTSASYTDDGGDTFTGTICGNLFRYERHDPDETERGTMTLDDSNHATIRSTWRTTKPPYCGGNCVDQLTRVSTP